MWAWIKANDLTPAAKYARSMSMIYVYLKPWVHKCIYIYIDINIISSLQLDMLINIFSNIAWWINSPVGRTMHAPSNPNMPSLRSPMLQQGLWRIHPALCPKESRANGNWRCKTLLSTLGGDPILGSNIYKYRYLFYNLIVHDSASFKIYLFANQLMLFSMAVLRGQRSVDEPFHFPDQPSDPPRLLVHMVWWSRCLAKLVEAIDGTDKGLDAGQLQTIGPHSTQHWLQSISIEFQVLMCGFHKAIRLRRVGFGVHSPQKVSDCHEFDLWWIGCHPSWPGNSQERRCPQHSWVTRFHSDAQNSHCQPPFWLLPLRTSHN